MTSHGARANIGWLIAAVIIVIIIVVASVLAYQLYSATPIYPTPAPVESPVTSATVPPVTGNVTITVYSGEISTSTYGFGSSAGNITSPGPTFTVKAGTKVIVDFHNAGSMSHDWAVVARKIDTNTLLAFPNAAVATPENPISPGGSGTTTFVASAPGTYFYICQIDNHVSLGMWGYFIITP